jgi:hypothetical protein
MSVDEADVALSNEPAQMQDRADVGGAGATLTASTGIVDAAASAKRGCRVDRRSALASRGQGASAPRRARILTPAVVDDLRAGRSA